MIPISSGKWILLLTSSGTGFYGKLKNSQYDWCFLSPFIRYASLSSKELSRLLSGEVVNGTNITSHGVWVEASGAEAFTLGPPQKPKVIDPPEAPND